MNSTTLVNSISNVFAQFLLIWYSFSLVKASPAVPKFPATVVLHCAKEVLLLKSSKSLSSCPSCSGSELMNVVQSQQYSPCSLVPKTSCTCRLSYLSPQSHPVYAVSLSVLLHLCPCYSRPGMQSGYQD